MERSKAVISETMRQSREPVGDDLEAVSDEAINFIVLETFLEPANAAQIKKLQEPKRS
jgi:hypothetical protein